jgi:hypothetical protein
MPHLPVAWTRKDSKKKNMDRRWGLDLLRIVRCPDSNVWMEKCKREVGIDKLLLQAL